MKNFSFFEIDKAYAKKIIKSFEDATFNNIPLVAEVANPKQSSQGNRRSDNFNRKPGFKKKYDRERKKGDKRKR